MAVEVLGNAGWKTASRHYKPVPLIERGKSVEACTPFRFAQKGPRKNKSVRFARRFVDHREILTRFARSGNRQSWHAFLIHKTPQQLADHTAGRIHGNHIGAQPLHHARDIYAAPAGITAFSAAPQLVKGRHSLDRSRYIDQRVYSEGDDLGHSLAPLEAKYVGARLSIVARPCEFRYWNGWRISISSENFPTTSAR